MTPIKIKAYVFHIGKGERWWDHDLDDNHETLCGLECFYCGDHLYPKSMALATPEQADCAECLRLDMLARCPQAT